MIYYSRETYNLSNYILDKISCKLESKYYRFMYVIIPKNATREEVKKALEKFEQKRKQWKPKGGKENVFKHFGSNPGEVDGLKFQKKSGLNGIDHYYNIETKIYS